MVVGMSLLDVGRPMIVSPFSLSGCRRIVLHGREKKRVNPRCAYSEGCNTESVDLKLPGVTLYDLLGISRQVGITEIKSAYREKARRYHPDANPPSKREECTKKFLQVREAYEVLADPHMRADYDYKLRLPHALTSGLHKGRNRRRRSESSPAGVVDELVNKEAWRAQWEAQVQALKTDLGQKKPGSWAAMMKQKRQEEAARMRSSDRDTTERID